MNGPIAQIVALTCHGNAFLQGAMGGGFFPGNSTCQFCESVKFVDAAPRLFRKPKETEIARSPDDWFSYLKNKGARGLRLVRNTQNPTNIADRMSAGLAGGDGTWGLEVLLSRRRSEFWVARWEVCHPQAPDRRIWKVTYGRVAQAATKPRESQNLQALTARFLESLRDIHSFSERHNCGLFTNAFSRSIHSLTLPERHGFHKDLAPSDFLPEQAMALLDAAQSAWVFGGMGSWDDLGFNGEDGREYARVSEGLFQVLIESICAAANASLRKGSNGPHAGEKKFWFPAKKYGWGWGPPTCWQGWVVLAMWLALLGVGVLLLPRHAGLYTAHSVILTLALIVVCHRKGEKPRWRWEK